MKKMIIGIVATMMVFGTTAMKAQHMGNGYNHNNGYDHGYATNDRGHNNDHRGGDYHMDGNHGHGDMYMGHGRGMDREMRKVREICHKKDMHSMNFRWTRRAVRAHRGMDRHYFVNEIVRGHHTGHKVCTVCGYHVH